LKPNNEASLKSVQSSIQPDGQFILPIIRLFTATLNLSSYSNLKSVPSSRWTVFFLGGFVFVAAVVVAQTQHRDKDFLGGFVFVAQQW
jgi:FtsH-binding integral membrane protein